MILTRHGERRVRGRMGLPKRTAVRTASRALAEGLRLHELTGPLRRYAEREQRRDGQTDIAIRVWHGYLYVFSVDGVLVTTWPLRPYFRRIAESLLRKRSFT